MKLAYWKAASLTDRDCYSIRARTLREAKALRAEAGASDFAAPVKIVIEYADAFDLVSQVKGEGADA